MKPLTDEERAWVQAMLPPWAKSAADRLHEMGDPAAAFFWVGAQLGEQRRALAEASVDYLAHLDRVHDALDAAGVPGKSPKGNILAAPARLALLVAERDALKAKLDPAPPEAIAFALCDHVYGPEADERAISNFFDLVTNERRLESAKHYATGAFIFGWRAAEQHRRGEGGR